MRELEDASWFPPQLREFQTDLIGFLATRWPGYGPLLAMLNDPKRETSALMDLCSGSGEPAISVFEHSTCFSRLTLTDLYPRPSFPSSDMVTYDPRPVDARTLEMIPGACYTMFNALHHFTDAEKVGLVHRLREGGNEAFLVEVLEPTPWCMAKVLVATTVGTLLFMPFVRPFSFARLFFTYVLPINVFTIAWDGVISVFRSRSLSQYRALFAADARCITVHRLPATLQAIIVIHLQRT